METTTPFLPTFSPLERIAVTATGNLQRIISSYYCRPVVVTCLENDEVAPGEYRRRVQLAVVFGEEERRVFCEARSRISIRSPEIEESVRRGTVGVGQLFRFYNILPEFRLVDAGRTQEGFWREYELSSSLIDCVIRENFRKDTFELDTQGEFDLGECSLPEEQD